MLYRETRHTNVPAVLMYSDRNAMAHSVEARFPYLDHRIVELCFSLPSSYKVGFGRRKRLLFETAKQYLPARVIESRKKKCFVLMSNWMPLRGQHAAGHARCGAQPGSGGGIPYVDARQDAIAFVDDYLVGTARERICGVAHVTRRRAGWNFQAMSVQRGRPRIALFGIGSRFSLLALEANWRSIG